MSLRKPTMIFLLALQVVAILIYPPTYFVQAPQAAVLPPALLILLVAVVAAMNAGRFDLTAGRTSLVFLQGINIVVRLMMLMPNLQTPLGEWNIFLFLAQLIGIALSWYTMLQLDKLPLRAMLLKKQTDSAA